MQKKFFGKGMYMTIDELLKNYREVFCMSEVEKGEHFERLMKNFLLTYAPYRGKIKSAWQWKNFQRFRH